MESIQKCDMSTPVQRNMDFNMLSIFIHHKLQYKIKQEVLRQHNLKKSCNKINLSDSGKI